MVNRSESTCVARAGLQEGLYSLLFPTAQVEDSFPHSSYRRTHPLRAAVCFCIDDTSRRWFTVAKAEHVLRVISRMAHGCALNASYIPWRIVPQPVFRGHHTSKHP